MHSNINQCYKKESTTKEIKTVLQNKDLKVIYNIHRLYNTQKLDGNYDIPSLEDVNVY